MLCIWLLRSEVELPRGPHESPATFSSWFCLKAPHLPMTPSQTGQPDWSLAAPGIMCTFSISITAMHIPPSTWLATHDWRHEGESTKAIWMRVVPSLGCFDFHASIILSRSISGLSEKLFWKLIINKSENSRSDLKLAHAVADLMPPATISLCQ